MEEQTTHATTTAARNSGAEGVPKVHKGVGMPGPSSSTRLMTADSPLQAVREAEIAEGVWKFVTVELSGVDAISADRAEANTARRLVVRSYAGLVQHFETYNRLMRQVRPRGLSGRVVGGGRIRKEGARKMISIYG